MQDYQEPSLPSLPEIWQSWQRGVFAHKWLVLGICASVLLHAGILLVGGGQHAVSPDRGGVASSLHVRLQPNGSLTKPKQAISSKKRRIIATEQRPSPAQTNLTKQDAAKPAQSNSTHQSTSVAGISIAVSFAMPSQALFDWAALSTLDTHFYLMSELDEGAKPLESFNPTYPYEARVKNIGGLVVFQVYISEFGWVEKVELVSEEPLGYFFAETVIAELENAYFTPAIKNGRYVKSVKKMEFVFDERSAALMDGEGTR